MANITKEERERRAALAAEGNPMPDAEETFVEADEAPEGRPLENFEKPVVVVKPDAPTPSGMAKVRVLPKGDGKVATGKYDRQTNSFTYHKKGDHLFVHPQTAKQQEDNGLVEIVED